MRSDGTGDRSLALFFLGILAFTPPLLMIFDVAVLWWGIPALYLYVFVAWAGLILLMGLSAARGGDRPARQPPPLPRGTDAGSSPGAP